MNQNYHTFPENSKVWIYQSSQIFDEDDKNFIKVRVDEFIEKWDSHGNLLKADFDVLNNLFLVFFVDEQGDRMCGSAQDRLLRLVKELEGELEVELLNRMNLSYIKNSEVYVAKMHEFSQLYKDGIINDTTLVFDNTVTTKAAFDTQWKLPLVNSWHKQIV